MSPKGSVSIDPQDSVAVGTNLTGGGAATDSTSVAIKNDLNYDSIAVEAEQLEKFDFPNQQGSIEIPIKNLIRLLESKNI